MSLRLLPAEAANEAVVKEYIARTLSRSRETVSGFRELKRSIDARGKKVLINLTVLAFIDEPLPPPAVPSFQFRDVNNTDKKVLIVGAGPAGLFAALRLIERGIKPVIIERGKEVRARRRDLAVLNKEGVVNPESNYCFGEGGAGTYSDGKLYTRSNKRGDIDRILQLFVYFGAAENILSDAHPHIGTNKLPQIITAMREKILSCGGEIHFEKKLVDFQLRQDQIISVVTADGDEMQADAFILATGHSARDIFYLLKKKNILIEAKPFALGVRVEHPQALIDGIQYHCKTQRDEFLPPASYALVQQTDGRGVFSFCMCPGGIIAPAATDAGELVVNGWSPSKRNNPFANSGMVVQTEKHDVLCEMKDFYRDKEQEAESDPLLFMEFQKLAEQKAYAAGGGNFKAPAQRMEDFVTGKLSATLPVNSYLPGLHAAPLDAVLPSFIYESLANAFRSFGKKMKGYYTNEAVVVAVESRTSSPVRIPRHTERLHHPQLQNLYPCGEGAGYAGGIVSAAMDGEKIADTVLPDVQNTERK